jgi:hypothetical protein
MEIAIHMDTVLNTISNWHILMNFVILDNSVSHPKNLQQGSWCIWRNAYQA